MDSPFFGEGADFLLEGPCVARLLVELPIRLGDRGWPHETFDIEVLHCLVALAFPDSIAHPSGIHAGIDHEMGDVVIARPEFARGALRNSADPNFSHRDPLAPDPPPHTGTDPRVTNSSDLP